MFLTSGAMKINKRRINLLGDLDLVILDGCEDMSEEKTKSMRELYSLML